MSNTLSVRITSRKTDAGEVFEGTVTLADATPFKLIRKADRTTRFPTRSAVIASARNFAKSYGFVDVNFGDTTATKPKVAAKTTPTTAKKAAKKSSVTKTTPQQTTTTVTRPNTSR